MNRKLRRNRRKCPEDYDWPDNSKDNDNPEF